MYPSFTPYTVPTNRRRPVARVCLRAMFYFFIGTTIAATLLIRMVGEIWSKRQRQACPVPGERGNRPDGAEETRLTLR